MTKTLLASVEEHQLANQAKLLLKPFDGAPRIALSIFLPGGNTLDPIPGYMDILDRLLMKGTTTRSQEDISVEIDSLTLEVDTDTRRDYSQVYATFLEEDWEPSLELIADLFFNSSFEEFEREKEKMAGEIQMDLDSPRSRASDQFIRKVFEGTPYNAVGSLVLENLDKMDSQDKAKGFYQQVYRPDRILFSVAGDNLKADAVGRMLETYFPASALGGPALPDETARIKQHQITAETLVTFARDDSSQCHIFKGWIAPEVKHPDYPAMVVLNTILGGAGLSSRLFLELRDKQGLAYNVRSSYESFKHSGLFSLYIGTEPKNKEKCLLGFIEECQKLIDIIVGAEELAEAKENILGRRTIYLETAPQLANFIGANYTLGRSLKDIDALPQRIQAVTAQDVQRVAQEYLAQPAVVSVVGPSAIL